MSKSNTPEEEVKAADLEQEHKITSERSRMSRREEEPARDHERAPAAPTREQHRPDGSLELPHLIESIEEREPTPEEVMQALYGSHAPFISPRQSVFLESYLTCFNAARAARAAGYSKPPQTGYYLLQDKRIKAAIAYRLEQAAMSAQEVLSHIVDIARADLADLVNPITLEPELIDTNTGSLKAGTNIIKKITSTRDGTSIETYSRLQALELLGRAHGLFIDRHQHTGLIGVAPISAETLQHIAATATEELTEWERRLLEEPTTTIDTTPTSTTTTTATASEDT